jgi:hypothetical protein
VRRSFLGSLAALVLSAATTLVSASPANAANSSTIWVDVRVSSVWPVTRAVSLVDSYTGTTMRYGSCRAGARCLVIREDRGLPWQWAAATYPGSPVTRIKLNPSRRGSPYAQRLHTLLHELGHARGLYAHNSRCTSVMYYSMRCPNGNLAPNTFTSSERRTLRRN